MIDRHLIDDTIHSVTGNVTFTNEKMKMPITYKTFAGTYETINGEFYDFEFVACDWDAMLGDLLDSWGEGRVFGVRVK